MQPAWKTSLVSDAGAPDDGYARGSLAGAPRCAVRTRIRYPERGARVPMTLIATCGISPFPPRERLFGNPEVADHIGDRGTQLHLLQHRHDLFHAEAFPFHGVLLSPTGRV